MLHDLALSQFAGLVRTFYPASTRSTNSPT